MYTQCVLYEIRAYAKLRDYFILLYKYDIPI